MHLFDYLLFPDFPELYLEPPPLKVPRLNHVCILKILLFLNWRRQFDDADFKVAKSNEREISPPALSAVSVKLTIIFVQKRIIFFVFQSSSLQPIPMTSNASSNAKVPQSNSQPAWPLKLVPPTVGFIFENLFFIKLFWIQIWKFR